MYLTYKLLLIRIKGHLLNINASEMSFDSNVRNRELTTVMAEQWGNGTSGVCAMKTVILLSVLVCFVMGK